MHLPAHSTTDSEAGSTTSQQGRHAITVRRKRWAIVNTHIESRDGSRDATKRRQDQLEWMSQSHVRDDLAADAFVLLGDFNLRPDQDSFLEGHGWEDAWWRSQNKQRRAAWTWKECANLRTLATIARFILVSRRSVRNLRGLFSSLIQNR